MLVKCVENNLNNTNFSVGKTYKFDEGSIQTDWGGIRVKCAITNPDKTFEFALCRFEIA